MINYLKYLYKYAVVLILAMILRPFLDILIISKFHLSTLLADRLRTDGNIIMIFIEIIGIPLFLSASIIGVIGGLWIRGKAKNGFILSLIFYLFEFIIGLSTGLKFDWVMLFSFLGLLIIPLFCTLIYHLCSKRCVSVKV